MATASLVLGIVSILAVCLVIPAVLALVFGLSAAGTIKRSNDSMAGLGIARAGWILGAASLVFLAAFVAASAVGVFDTSEHSDSGFAVGDCVDLSRYVDSDGSGADAEGDELPIVDCSVPHDGEVYHLGEIEGFDEFPGERTVWSHVDVLCAGEAFTDYVGVDDADSELGVFSFAPSAETWRLGDRAFMCVVTGVDGEPLVGSVRGSNR